MLHGVAKYCTMLLGDLTHLLIYSLANLLVPNHVKIVTMFFAFRLAAPTTWNDLPDFVKAAESFSVFKHCLKCHLFDMAFLKSNSLVPTGISVSQPLQQ